MTYPTSSMTIDSVRTAQFKGTPVRIITADNALWFVASDIFRCLSVQNTTTAVQNLREDETRLVSILGSRPLNALSEHGLRKRLTRSRKMEAQALLDWTQREVIRECERAEEQPEPDAVQRLAARVTQLERQLSVLV
ncbi:BRO-N domain-containing protein [Noviherbaspirillum aridicola]|uniref:Bro-N domain-containing protein n=1 Tax=Noviherbaspirillum aridicola TaxID=2849687 RepID=A0ABQ4Q4S5_9BURK|nr:BRO family protein [Noviherbaspirillum aridicola]GIZ51739.1 hypothetical protein NCCP691_17530 [Noviherbaspirillum aridicola]